MKFSGESQIPELLRMGSKIAFLPVIHGSGQFALTVRRWMLEESFDCVAVPLPESFREPVEEAVLELPRPSIVIQPASTDYETAEFESSEGWDSSETYDGDDDTDEEPDSPTFSYVPVDPCQSVIMSIRAAMGEHIPREYIDLETDPFRPYATVMPDPFAVRHVSPERFAAAVLPSITRPPDHQTRARMVHMAARLSELEKKYERILLVISVLYWPWIREAYNLLSQVDEESVRSETTAELELPEHDLVQTPIRYAVKKQTLIFLFGELPFITGLYERARSELEEDEDLQIDGVKELLIAAQDSYRKGTRKSRPPGHAAAAVKVSAIYP